MNRDGKELTPDDKCQSRVGSSRLTLPDRQFRSCLEAIPPIATHTTSLHLVLIQFRLGVTPLLTQLILP
jgi:hypothetical protein